MVSFPSRSLSPLSIWNSLGYLSRDSPEIALTHITTLLQPSCSDPPVGVYLLPLSPPLEGGTFALALLGALLSSR